MRPRENELAADSLDPVKELVDTGPLRLGDDMEEDVGCCDRTLVGTGDLSSLE